MTLDPRQKSFDEVPALATHPYGHLIIDKPTILAFRVGYDQSEPKKRHTHNFNHMGKYDQTGQKACFSPALVVFSRVG